MKIQPSQSKGFPSELLYKNKEKSNNSKKNNKKHKNKFFFKMN